MSRLLSTLFCWQQGFTLRASRSIARHNELGDRAAGVFALIILVTLLADGFGEYVNAKVDARTAELVQKADHAEKILVACMNGGAIKTGEWTAIFCDPSKEHRL